MNIDQATRTYLTGIAHHLGRVASMASPDPTEVTLVRLYASDVVRRLGEAMKDADQDVMFAFATDERGATMQVLAEHVSRYPHLAEELARLALDCQTLEGAPEAVPSPSDIAAEESALSAALPIGPIPADLEGFTPIAHVDPPANQRAVQ